MSPKSTNKPFWMFSVEADTDYLLARMINFLGSGFSSRAGFFAQQACEKYMKAIMLQLKSEYSDIHKLLPLADVCKQYDPYFAEKNTARILEQFDLFDQIGRYGGLANFDPVSKGKTIGGLTLNVSSGVQFAGAFAWHSTYLDDLDGFVFKSRSLLTFSSAEIGFDYIKGILDNNQTMGFLRDWEGKQPLREILTRGNRYFCA